MGRPSCRCWRMFSGTNRFARAMFRETGRQRSPQRAGRKAHPGCATRLHRGGRGFVSILGSKGGEKVESAKNAAASAPTASPSSPHEVTFASRRRFRLRPGGVPAFGAKICDAIRKSRH
jgi:hypothetical protein